MNHMNMNAQMQDPSSGIHRELLPHVHLVSTYRFPTQPHLHPDKVADWLINAPQITRDKAPFYWTYIDRPQDGTILLVWQSQSLGTEFPSDGYVYGPMETAFQLEVNNGYTLEMYHHKVGYAPGEPVATHTRRRYRLLPSKFPNAPTPDISLWIVHYSQCEPQERIPSQVIPIDHRLQSMMQTRGYLQQQGQLVQKEFMLHDRTNWPQISFPRGQNRGPQNMYARNIPPPHINPNQAYNLQHQQPGPPAKRVRTQQNINQSMIPGGVVAAHEVDDEEDTQRGDFFDHTTPREISTGRYKQNHEWMEEILSSPYAIHQIIPSDLGLGLRGELATLTEGTFDSPYDPGNDVEKHQYVGRLDPEKADEFRKKAMERIAETNKDIEKMKAKHAKRLAKFRKGALFSTAEKELRTAVSDPTDIGPEYWRLEGRIDEEDSEEGSKSAPKIPSKVENILAQVEASLGRSAIAVQELRRVQDGGFEEVAVAINSAPSPKPNPHPAHSQSLNGGTPRSGMGNDLELDMDNSAAGLLDQYHTGLSSNSNATPGSNYAHSPHPLMQSHSASGTPGMHVPSPQPAQHISPAPQVQPQVAPAQQEMVTTASNNGTGDWVVVPPGGVSPSHNSNEHSAAAPGLESGTNTPQQDFAAPNDNDFADLEDLDTAAGYDGHDGDAGDGDLGLGIDDVMDDSAFGEAFHGVEREMGSGEEGGGGEGL